MKILFVSWLLLIFASTTHGQTSSVVTDTLDWRRYFPLEIGNTWEYGGLDSYVSTIVGDTMVNGYRYYIKQDSTPAVGTLGPFIHTFYVRYDTAGTVLTLLSLEEDTLEAPLPLNYWRTDFPDFLGHFDMRMSFGDTLYYGAPDTLYAAEGGYAREVEVGPQFVEVDAQKCFREQGFTAGWVGCYATDIGFLGGGNLFASKLNYARVGGVEYGRQSVSVEAVVAPSFLSIATVYPNPFNVNTTIVYELSGSSTITLEVFNVLGKQVWVERLPMQPPGLGRYLLENEQWPAGYYFVRLSTEHGTNVIRSIVKTE